MTEPSPPSSAQPIAPGWYPDPEDPNAVRWWDGERFKKGSIPREGLILAADADDVEGLLARGAREGGGGTLMTEPVLVFRGGHDERFAVFDQAGNEMGSAVPSAFRRLVLKPARAAVYDFLDRDGSPMLSMEDVGSKVAVGKWAYELRVPHTSGVVRLRRVNRWPLRDKGLVERGSHEIATLRESKSRVSFVVEDRSGSLLARAQSLTTGWRRGLSSKILVELVDHVPDEIRQAALAMALVLDREKLSAPD